MITIRPDLTVLIAAQPVDFRKGMDALAGLVATSLGLSKQFTNDHEMLEHAMAVYDGLYAWCRAEQAGDHERHGWNVSS